VYIYPVPPRTILRSAVASPPHAGKRNTVARNSVDGLVMVESIVFKRLGTRVDGWWNAAATTIPAVLHEILCTAATDRVAEVLGCAERVTVFAGLAGQMYTSVPGPNQSQSRAVARFFEHSMFLYIKPQDKLSFSEEDARREREDGTIKEFVPAAELRRRAAQGEFGERVNCRVYVTGESKSVDPV